VARSFTGDRKRITALRLAAQGIDRPATSDPVGVVRHLLALQSQDYASGLWTIGVRTKDATRDDVEAAQASGTIVRSWPMRGTLHFVAADDLGWMLELTAERIIRSAAGRHRQLELADADFDRAAAIARERLAGGAHLGRRELLAAFDEGGVATAGQRGVHLLGKLAQLRIIVLCSQADWALYDEWIPNPRRLERDDALREFAARYFTGHGPATIRDFSWWSSLTLTDARRGLELAREQLDELELDGVSYYLRPDLEPAKAAVHLLPGFDEYLLGYSDRSAPLAGEGVEIIVPGGNGVFLPTIVVNGEVVGSWRRATKGATTTLTPLPFHELSASARAGVEKAARRYGRFLGAPVALTDY
jgi:hypothetical protein